MVLNVIIVGVGGQGLLSTAQLLGWASLESNANVLVAETHGLSQRGGSVIVHVRIGDVTSPLIPVGRANVMLALELLEAVRYIRYMRYDSVAIVNRKLIKPNVPGVTVEKEERLTDIVSNKVRYTYFIDATGKALSEGNPVGANMVVLGFLGNMLERAGILRKGLLGSYAEKVGRGRIALINKRLFDWGYTLAGREVSDEVVRVIGSWYQEDTV